MGRSRLIPLIVLVLAAVMLGHHLATWSTLSSSQMKSSDYTPTYIAAEAWRAHDGTNPYDLKVQIAGHRAIGTPPQTQALAYANPPLAAVAAAPFSLLGFLASYRLFALTQLLVLAAAILIGVRAASWPRSTPRLAKAAVALAALAGTGTEVLLLQAQWDGALALGVAVAYAAWRSRRPGWAGVAIALTFGLAKPHLVFGLVAFLLARGERKATLAAALTTVGMVAVTFLVVGIHGSLAFLDAPGLSVGVSPLATMLGITGLVFSNLQGGAIAAALSVAGGAVAVALAAVLGAVSRRHPDRLEIALGGAALLTLLAAPHLLVHDLVVLTPLLAPCVAWAMSRARPVRASERGALGLLLAWLTLSLAASADIGNGTVGAPGRLVPWVLLAGSAAAVVATVGSGRRLRRLEAVAA